MYFLLTIILFFLALLLKDRPIGNAKKVFICISTVLMVLVSGLRHEEVGNDTYGTMMKFEKVSNMAWIDVFSDFWSRYLMPTATSGKDPGEEVVMKLMSYISTDSRVFLFIAAFIVLSSFGFFVYKNSKSLNTVLLSYVFFINFFYAYVPNSSFRQPMALAMLYFAYNLLQNKKSLYFCIIVFIASFLHKSVLIAALLLLLYKVKSVKWVFYGSLVAFGYMLFNYEQVGELLGATNDVYADYLDSTYYTRADKPYMIILLYIAFYLLGLWCSTRDTKMEEYKLQYLGLTLSFVFIPMIWIDPSALRLIAYFGIFIPILIGRMDFDIFKRNLFSNILLIILALKIYTTNDKYYFMWESQSNNMYGYVSSVKTAPITSNKEII